MNGKCMKQIVVAKNYFHLHVFTKIGGFFFFLFLLTLTRIYACLSALLEIKKLKLKCAMDNV